MPRGPFGAGAFMVGVMAFSAGTPAAATQSQGSSWKVVGQAGGPARCVAVQGTRAWVGVGFRLVGLDVSNPADLKERGATAPFPHVVQDVALSGTLAYVAAGGAGLRIVDISNPALPTEIGAWDSRGYAEGVATADSFAYLADGPYGLRVFDVSKPSQPVEVGSAYPMSYAFKVAVQGHHAYIAAAGSGLLIADVADPRRPVALGGLATNGYAYGVAVAGSTVYVAEGWEGLKIVNVADPARPVEIATYKTPGWAMAVTVSGTKAYVADAFGGLRVLDVTDPSRPAETACSLMPKGHAGSVALGEGVAYVVDQNWGLRAVGLSPGPDLPQIGSYRPMGFADAVAVAGNLACVAAGNFGLGVIDISDPTRPRQVGGLELEGYARDVAMSGKYAFVATMGPRVPSALHVVDISDPTHPVRVGFSDCTGGGRGLDVAGGIAYIANETGLKILSVADPGHPACVGFLRTKERETDPETTTGVAVSGKTAYVVADTGGLITADVSDPANPVRLGTYKVGSDMHFNDVAVAGDRAYVADTSFGLRLLDVADPAHPVAMGSLWFPGPQGVSIAGNLAYVAVGDSGLIVVDVSDPNRPTLVGTVQTGAYARQVAAAGERAYLAGGPIGLLILEKTAGASDRSLAAAPAPSVTFSPAVPRGGKRNLPAARHGLGAESRRSSIAPATAAACLVTSASDSGPGTLRWCLGNASTGTTITFDTAVFPPASPVAIHVLSPLPGLAGGVTLDASDAGVILDGSEFSQPPPGHGVSSGLFVPSDGNRVMGLQILRFPGNGIDLLGSHNIIGGDRAGGRGPTGQGNVISGNGQAGISINHGFGTCYANTVVGNLIGTDASGLKALGNKDVGVIVLGAEANRIGGLNPGEGNVVSGNGHAGVRLGGGATQTLIAGNYVGTDLSGSQRLGNWMGISIEDGSFDNVVRVNLVSGNNGAGIAITDPFSSYNAVLGNLVGTDATGTRALPNEGSGIGVGFMGSTYNRIGGTRPGDGNLVSGNSGGGIGVLSQDNFVRGNYVGIDISGRKPLGNTGGGVGLSGGRSFLGGTTPQEANVIGGNGWGGVAVESDYITIAGNYIGTDPSGEVPIGNVAAGVWGASARNTLLQANVIAHTSFAPGNAAGAGINVDPLGHATIRRNSIHGNAAQAIAYSRGDLSALRAPVINAITTTAVSGTACPGCEVEIFSDGEDEGRVFEGSVVADGSGAFRFSRAWGYLTGPNVTATATDEDGSTSEFSSAVAAPAPPPQSLSLSRRRVLVTVEWKNPYGGERGTAYALPQNDQFGFFSYSDPNNPEVFVKVLDFGSGTALCFVGGLTDFHYKVTFTVAQTGQKLVFEKPPYQYIGFVDATTLKYAGAPGVPAGFLTGGGGMTFVGALSTGQTSSSFQKTPAQAPQALAAAPQSLALSSGRVSVIVDWRNPYSGETGRAYGIPKADPFGFFYYTDRDNPEVFVKVLDFGDGIARVFVGGLTDFYYKVTFRVLQSGQTLVFEKPPYQYIGFADNGTLKF